MIYHIVQWFTTISAQLAEHIVQRVESSPLCVCACALTWFTGFIGHVLTAS